MLQLVLETAHPYGFPQAFKAATKQFRLRVKPEFIIRMKININSQYKSIPRGINFEVPKFCILTGKNGSGKTHLLEAIAHRHISQVFIDEAETKNIHYIGYNGLAPEVDEQSDSAQLANILNSNWQQILAVQDRYKQHIAEGKSFSDFHSQSLILLADEAPSLYSSILRALKQTSKNLDELTQHDVAANFSFADIGNNQIFNAQLALTIKAYHSRKTKNEFAEFLASKYGHSSSPFLSNEEFVKKYGPPPWEVINDILTRAGLQYKIATPENIDFDLPYRLRLIDQEKNLDISANDLSSGEKVLMSLVLAIYNTSENGSKPDVLLLDEPDAPLHPKFSKLLIDIIENTIVQKAGISVIISTHSPSTVAMAPVESVFEIDKETKIPRMVSNSDAVRILTDGIDFLRVFYEKRKQIFVEHRNDVQYYERLFNVLNRKYHFEFQPVFLEPHSGSSNCTDVISIVEKLRGSGSDLAYGIIDFDRTHTGSEAIVVLGGSSRYAIENYLLDPLYLVLALIKHRKKSFNDFGISEKIFYTEAPNLSQSECQTVIENFLTPLDFDIKETSSVILENGFTLQYPKSFLLHQGHDYETKVRARYVELNAVAAASKVQGDSALKLGVLQVIEEFPSFLPLDISETFKTVLG